MGFYTLIDFSPLIMPRALEWRVIHLLSTFCLECLDAGLVPCRVVCGGCAFLPLQVLQHGGVDSDEEVESLVASERNETQAG